MDFLLQSGDLIWTEWSRNIVSFLLFCIIYLYLKINSFSSSKVDLLQNDILFTVKKRSASYFVDQIQPTTCFCK